jgi:hypothetical protein
MAQSDMFGGLGMISLGVLALIALFFLYRSFSQTAQSKGGNSGNGATAAPAPQAPKLSTANDFFTTQDDGANTANNGGGNGDAMDVAPEVQPAPLGFAPYGATDDSSYFADYPQSEDPSSVTGDGSPSSYDMNLSALMPASWRDAGNCASVDAGGDSDEWGKYAPSKSSFENYITAAGSARLGMNTRVRNPTGGIANLLRPAPPVPMSAADVTFNDSSFRQDLVYDSMGMYPTQVQC